MQRLVADFETANTEGIDLPTVGAEVYSLHPATEILCLCVRNGQDTYVWKPGDDEAWLRECVLDPDVMFEAHGSFFEQMIWRNIMVKRYGFPPIPLRRWACTMAAAFYKGLPGKLERAGAAVHLPVEKDMEGSRFTINLSKPMTKKAHEEKWPGPTVMTKAEWNRRYTPTPDRSPQAIQRVVRYCAQDCYVEDELSHVTGPLSDYERRVWELDQTINHRGVRVDLDFVRQAIKVVEGARRPLEKEFADLTGGLEIGQVAKITEWCGKAGLALPSLDKPTMKRLGIGEEADGQNMQDIPPAVRRVLEIRAMLGSSSVKKLYRMLECVSPLDGRVRGVTQYHAACTGRWGGRLFQPQNFPRGLVTIRNSAGDEVPPKQEDLIAAIMTGDYTLVGALYGDAIKAVATALRGALIPDPDRLYAVGDFAGIEMRVVLALAGQHDKCELLATGKDVYLDMACDIYNMPKGSLTKKDVEKRTIGKNTVLGCGFQMGGKTFRDRYCPDQSEQFAKDVIEAYRRRWAPMVPQLWYGLEAAALEAVETGGRADFAGIEYEIVRHAGHVWLAAHIPDGQTMWYYSPMLKKQPVPWKPGEYKDGWSYMTLDEGVWRSVHAYGGLLTENIVQKIARGFLVEAMYRLEEAGFPVVLTVHDEIVTEPPEWRASWNDFHALMAEPSRYARWIKAPIEVEGFVGDRYRK